MKKIVLAALLALAGTGAAQAGTEQAPTGPVVQVAEQAGRFGVAAADLRAIPLNVVVEDISAMSELPEPEVFAMMLLGLCLIGYRASRDSDEKFT